MAQLSRLLCFARSGHVRGSILEKLMSSLSDGVPGSPCKTKPINPIPEEVAYM